MTNSNQPDRAKNVIIAGLGYLNRVREVTPKNGQAYLACDVALMQGTKDKSDLARFSCIVRGKHAIDVVREHFTTPNGEVKSPKATVMAAMTLGGITAQTFEYERGEKKGQTGIALRSSLLSFTWLKIGNVVVDLGPGEKAADGTASQAEPATGGEPSFVSEMRAEFKRNGSISLAKEHPEFEARKSWLRDNDFRWDRKKSVWVAKSTGPSEPAAERELPAQATPVGTSFAIGGFGNYDLVGDGLPY